LQAGIYVTISLAIPKVWELLKLFKNRCQSRGWKTSQYEDWIRAGKEYHNLLWIRNIPLSTFERVATRHKCGIREGASYRVVDVSYTAWLLQRNPPEKMIKMIREKPQLLKRTAIYDLSGLNDDKRICSKLNKTNSIVFQEFERFLEDTWRVEFKSSHKLAKKGI